MILSISTESVDFCVNAVFFMTVDPEKLKKQADFGCFNGLYMLLWNKSLDVGVFDN